MRSLALSEITLIFAAGILVKCLSDLAGLWPHFAQVCLWSSYVLWGMSAVLFAHNRWLYRRHRHDFTPEVPREK